jgi:hypothetical protein
MSWSREPWLTDPLYVLLEALKSGHRLRQLTRHDCGVPDRDTSSQAGERKILPQAVCCCNEAENLTVGIVPREETERLRLPGDRVGPYPAHAAKFLTG